MEKEESFPKTPQDLKSSTLTSSVSMMMERVTDSDIAATKPAIEIDRPTINVKSGLKGTAELIEGNDDKETETPKNDDLLKMNTGLLPFPESLMSLLDSDKETDIIRWLPDGDAFCLVPALFAERVLDKYFQGSKFESFTRKLNRWGFKRVAGQKVPPNTIAYYHKDFLRGKPRLVKNMNGGKSKSTSAKEKMIRDKQQTQQKNDDNDEKQNATLFAMSQAKLDHFHHGGMTAAPSSQGLLGSFNQNQLRMLEMNSMSLEQELQNQKIQQMLLANSSLQQQFFDNKPSFNQQLQQQQQQSAANANDAQQMAALIRQQTLMHAMRDNASAISAAGLTQNQWLNATQANLPIGPNSLNPSHFGSHPASLGSNMNLSHAGRLMLAQQQQYGVGSNNPMSSSTLQRLMDARATAGSSNMGNNDTHLQLQQQLLLEQQRQFALASAAAGVSNSPQQSPQRIVAAAAQQAAIGGGGNPTDRHLLELYLLHQQQQRNSGGGSGSTPSNANNSDTNR